MDAHVSIMVTEYNSKRFLVLGAVKSPGSYSLQAQERVLDAVTYQDDARRLILTPVVCRWKAGQAQPIGSSECRWVTFSELEQLEMPPVNAEIIARMRHGS